MYSHCAKLIAALTATYLLGTTQTAHAENLHESLLLTQYRVIDPSAIANGDIEVLHCSNAGNTSVRANIAVIENGTGVLAAQREITVPARASYDVMMNEYFPLNPRSIYYKVDKSGNGLGCSALQCVIDPTNTTGYACRRENLEALTVGSTFADINTFLSLKNQITIVNKSTGYVSYQVKFLNQTQPSAITINKVAPGRSRTVVIQAGNPSTPFVQPDMLIPIEIVPIGSTRTPLSGLPYQVYLQQSN